MYVAIIRCIFGSLFKDQKKYELKKSKTTYNINVRLNKVSYKNTR